MVGDGIYPYYGSLIGYYEVNGYITTEALISYLKNINPRDDWNTNNISEIVGLPVKLPVNSDSRSYIQDIILRPSNIFTYKQWRQMRITFHDLIPLSKEDEVKVRGVLRSDFVGLKIAAEFSLVHLFEEIFGALSLSQDQATELLTFVFTNTIDIRIHEYILNRVNITDIGGIRTQDYLTSLAITLNIPEVVRFCVQRFGIQTLPDLPRDQFYRGKLVIENFRSLVEIGFKLDGRYLIWAIVSNAPKITQYLMTLDIDINPYQNEMRSAIRGKITRRLDGEFWRSVADHYHITV